MCRATLIYDGEAYEADDVVKYDELTYMLYFEEQIYPPNTLVELVVDAVGHGGVSVMEVEHRKDGTVVLAEL